MTGATVNTRTKLGGNNAWCCKQCSRPSKQWYTLLCVYFSFQFNLPHPLSPSPSPVHLSPTCLLFLIMQPNHSSELGNNALYYLSAFLRESNIQKIVCVQHERSLVYGVDANAQIRFHANKPECSTCHDDPCVSWSNLIHPQLCCIYTWMCRMPCLTCHV